MFMPVSIVTCPFCSLLTFAQHVTFPNPYCSHVVITPPVSNATFLMQVKK